jgi:hypothetical protein
VLLRKRDETIDVERLERHRPGNDREAPALMHNVAQLVRESEALREELASAAMALREFAGRREELERHAADLRARLAVIENSKSWNLTRPLRDAAERIRRRARPRHR